MGAGDCREGQFLKERKGILLENQLCNKLEIIWKINWATVFWNKLASYRV